MRRFGLILALLLASCTPGGPSGEEAEGEDPNTAASEPESNVLIAYPDRFGPFRIGSSYQQLAGEHDLKLEYSSEVEDWDNPQPTGKGCESFSLSEDWPFAGLMFEDGILTRVDFYRPFRDAQPRKKSAITEQNIGLGSRIEAAKQAYGDALTQTPHPYLEDQGSYLTWDANSAGDGPKHGIVFETDEHTVTSFRIGDSRSIQYIEGCL
ncbi:hypothetical protein SAMN02745824_0390 [Parasphingorhabdus marina DSM 22363]|uniref:Uncharacterized protein n=1 Tax=Parasphingorhabdus marina DSM 22363 TaxID=1123272 RepID=A0A1N6CMR9_9SPHN|nr:hypothetical protein [Parasphingorhabdus marina]SIN59853.1 hypothetical protein SAMN02745824_0390 [Parasphingorhabdus marina DSM 22363]